MLCPSIPVIDPRSPCRFRLAAADERHWPSGGKYGDRILTDTIKAPTEPANPEAVPAPEGLTEIIETPYEIGQDNFNYRRRFVFELDIHNVVFSVSALGIVGFTILTLSR